MVALNLKQGLTMADFSNAVVRAFIDITIIGGIYFFLCSIWGEPPSVGVYLIIYPLISIITVSFEIIYDNVKANSDKYTHRALLNKVGESSVLISGRGSAYQLWGMITLYALMFYIILLLPFYFLLQNNLLSSQLNIWLALIISFLLVVFSSCLIVSRLKHYAIESYGKLFSIKKVEVRKEDSDLHIIFNYFLPWAIIAGAIAGLLAYGYFREESGNFTEVITVSVVAFSSGGTSYIISLWIAYVTQKQTILDIKANLLHFEKDDKLDESSMYFLIHVFSACVIALIFIVTHFLSIDHLSPIQITVIETVVGATSAVAGSLAGLLRGRAKVLSQKYK
ncbi:DUF6347 domain-containing protein [Xenorhabdus cabanillasii]|uniref:Uncharacterized protein n=2 Tax=Xenorhabdus cabanillasii TaxID=351673 RepID=A0A3D9UNU5_9GAMM|nr:DUF6347 domain-containing protein [Xenorhabdus cabanillasii]PHM77381.1 hypothetical protein Xcab_02059 [Xenorhabdus cabanillasii JM26]REF27674.1 hypothetical protein BDD26_2487 [Xenorhabdus cabanillasii]CDL85995.1 conserved membrane hypothetical protein [Xenorhabdus cabanillasii JM26]